MSRGGEGPRQPLRHRAWREDVFEFGGGDIGKLIELLQRVEVSKGSSMT